MPCQLVLFLSVLVIMIREGKRGGEKGGRGGFVCLFPALASKGGKGGTSSGIG